MRCDFEEDDVHGDCRIYDNLSPPMLSVKVFRLEDEYISFNKVFRSTCLAALCGFFLHPSGKDSKSNETGEVVGEGINSLATFAN